MKEKNHYSLEMFSVFKSFGGVSVLNDVSIQIKKKEIVGLLGSNGAGKSTLVKILSGVYKADKATIKINHQTINISSSKDAINNGIHFLPQELSIHPDLTIAENVFLGDLFTKNYFGIPIINQNKINQKAQEILIELGLSVDVSQPMSSLSPSQMRIVEMARSIVGEVKILIMDEPTAALSLKESDLLFKVLQKLSKRGVSVIYISHNLEEVFKICSRIYVLRDSKNAGLFKTKTASENEVLEAMLGKVNQQLYTNFSKNIGKIVFEAKKFSVPKKIEPLDLEISAGEIYGIFGLIGSGKEEIGRALYGFYKNTRGNFLLKGNHYKTNSIISSKAAGIGFVPAERKHEAIIAELSVGNNISLPFLQKFLNICFINKKLEQDYIEEKINSLNIICQNFAQPIRLLSGGNQQKICITRWLVKEIKMLILEEPTRGVDMGARREIYLNLRKLADSGMVILVISSDVEEIAGICDHSLVLSRGVISKKFGYGAKANELMLAAGGVA